MTRIAQSIRTFRFMTEYVIVVVVIYIGKSKRVKGIFPRLQWHLAEGWRIWFYGVWFSVPFLFGRYLHGFWWLWESAKRAAEHADPLTAFNGRTREDRDTRELQGIGSSYRLSHWRRERDRLASMVAPARPVGVLKFRDFFRWLNKLTRKIFSKIQFA